MDEYERCLSKKVIDAVDDWGTSIEQPQPSGAFEAYKRYVWLKWTFIAACIVITAALVAVAADVGSYDIGFVETYQIIWDHICGDIEDPTKDYVVIQLRLPRIVTALVAGAALASAGVVMQSILMNPLADPYTTGVSSGASFGATIAITLGASIASGQYAIIANAFVCALIPTSAIVAISRYKSTSPTVMIMAGIAVMYLFNACTTVLMLWADPFAMDEVYQWQVGSVSNARWEQIPLMAVVTVIGLALMQMISGKLNILATGDDSAKSMGVDAVRLRTLSLILVALVSAVIVSFTGLIGFVGLVAPHIVRLFVGADNRYLIPASAIFGGMLLIAADIVGRIVIAPSVLQVGVITAFMGAPLFLWLLLRKDSNVWS